MKHEKDIEQHLDQLLSQAESIPKIKTSTGFTERLNASIDLLEEPHFTTLDFFKYAAIIGFIVLNAGAFYSFSATGISQTDTTDQISSIAEQYFPDYTAYPEME